MKLLKLLALLILLSFSKITFAVDYYSLLNGDWFLGGMWARNSTTVGCGCNPDANGACDIIIPANAVVYIRHNVTTSCNISIGSNATLVIQNGGAFTLTGNASMNGTGDFQVDAGGTVNIGGDFNLSGNGDVTVNGTVNVTGDLNFGGSSSLCGTGFVNVGADVNGGGPCVSVTLPISLLYFNAFPSGIVVETEWVTLSEQNNLYFTVERSSDGINYTPIGQVSGAGNSNFTLSYQFTDESPLNGISYYRLAQTDINNVIQRYPPVVVNRNDVHVTPNLIEGEDEIYVYVNGFEEKLVSLDLVDGAGKKIVSSTFEIKSNNERLILNPNRTLASGMYFIYLHTSEKSQAIKLVVH